MQILFQAITPIEAQNLLNLIEVSCFPEMKKEGQSKTLNRLKKLAYGFSKTETRKPQTTKELFKQLGSK